MLKLIRDQSTISSIMKNYFRCCATKINNCEDNNVSDSLNSGQQMKKRSKKYSENSIKIKEYLRSINSENLIDTIPSYMVRRTPKSSTLYIVDYDVAKKFADLVSDELTSDPNVFIAETNPGFGLLTENLLQMPISKIHLFENIKSFLKPNSRLAKIIAANPDRLELRKTNLLDLWSMVFKDRHDQTNNMEKLFTGAKKMKWKDKPYMKVVGTAMSPNFVKQLIMSTIFQNTFMSRGRVIFYLMMDPSLWETYVTANKSQLYGSRSVMFQTMFDYKKIETFPRKSFLPWPIIKEDLRTTLYNNLKKLEYEFIYLVRIEPKVDLFDNIGKQDLLSFHYFIKHHLQKRHTRIIPALEHWIPGCGPRLIMRDFNIYTEFRDLDVKELLNLYREFTSWPEFEECCFLDSLEAFYDSLEDATLAFGEFDV